MRRRSCCSDDSTATPRKFGTATLPEASVPTKLPLTVFAPPPESSTPYCVFPEMTLRREAAVPPIVFDAELETHAVPVAARGDAVEADADVVRRDDVVVAAADQLDAVPRETVDREALNPEEEAVTLRPAAPGPRKLPSSSISGEPE